jgi:hypothetical protein
MLGQLPELGTVPVRQQDVLARHGQTLGGVLANEIKHPEARGTYPALHLWVPKTCVTWADALHRGRPDPAFRCWAGRSWSVRRCDDLRLVGLKLIFLAVIRAVSVLGLSRREAWWKDAEILMLRHQLAVALREQPRAHSRLTWPDRAWLAVLAGTLRSGVWPRCG